MKPADAILAPAGFSLCGNYQHTNGALTGSWGGGIYAICSAPVIAPSFYVGVQSTLEVPSDPVARVKRR
jgi:hypothetical protein